MQYQYMVEKTNKDGFIVFFGGGQEGGG